MCNQDNCPHSETITPTERELKVAHALLATMFMRIHMGTNDDRDSVDYMIGAGACAIDCPKPDCACKKEMLESLAAAIDHVDNGAPLEAISSYEKLGFLVDGKTPSSPSLFDKLSRAIEQGARLKSSAFIDTVIVDPGAGLIDLKLNEDEEHLITAEGPKPGTLLN